MLSDITFLAKTNFRNKEQVFGIKRADRRQHMYVVGKTGVGKTAFLKNMALQDIQNGEGLAIIDPHGEFVEDILDSIPSHRINDVVYFNPVDMEYPVSFNILEVTDPQYKHLVASGLIGIFTKIWANVWSARMEYILANCILALLDTPGTTLLGIPRILVDRDYRQKIINNLKDPVVKSFWVNEYEEWSQNYRNEAIAPVQNKVGQFLNVSFIRNIVGQSKNTIDIDEIMNTGKILLVNVSKGRIGEDNSAILGAMIITKIQLSAMERVRIPEEKRRDFYMYVDEFQNFATDSFVNILSEARKYRLNLIIAHQYIGQLVTETTTAVRDSVFGNVGTMACFRVGAADAEFLEQEFTPEFLQDDLIRLPNYCIYIKLMIDGITCRAFSAKTLPPVSITDPERKNREKIIRVTRERYARDRIDAEAEITRWSGNVEPQNMLIESVPRQSQNQSGTLYDATCTNCGKKTKTIFKPEPGKPVYCKSCLKKLKRGPSFAKMALEGQGQGKNQPTFSQETTPFRRRKSEKAEDLERLGIEFESAEGFRPISRQPESGEGLKIEKIPFHLPKRKKEEAVRTAQNKRKEINLAELKKALEESLSNKEEEKVIRDASAAKKDLPVTPEKTEEKTKESIENAADNNVVVEKPREQLKKEEAMPTTQEEANDKQDNNQKKGPMNPGQKIKL